MQSPTDDLLSWIGECVGARDVELVERVQELWSGYGEILRVRLSGCAHESLILKRVDPPTVARHPRGWNTDRSHERKLRSYSVERAFYEHFADRCRAAARVPLCFATRLEDGRCLLLLEDLDAAGFASRRTTPSESQLEDCLRWLAGFHAAFLRVEPNALWPVGTYWHLDTRPDEFAVLDDERLRAAAPILDARLNECEFRTFVHGDAKVANFCFPDQDGHEGVSAVDFQYVGGGCGIKDVAYFLSSCMSEVECEARAPRHLDAYFSFLGAAIRRRDPSVDVAAVEAEWRSLYPIAWADFYRFLAGWSPDHWKIHGYSDRLTQLALDEVL